MYYKIFFSLLTFITLFISIHAQSQNSPKALFITSDGQLTPLLIELLKLDDIYHEGDTLHDAVTKTQSHWLAVRQGNQQIERTDLVDTPQQAAQSKRVLEIVKAMGLIDEISPALQHYDYGICLGAFLDGVRMRLASLVKAWKQGVHFDTLVFLTGERYLRTEPGQEDSFEKLCDATDSPLPFKSGWTAPEGTAYVTEYDMVKLVWDQVQIPEDMAAALENRVIFVNAERGNNARPSTKDTYFVWQRDYKPTPGTILAPSHPLLWVHQHLAGASTLGNEFFLDTTAPALSQKSLELYRHAIVSLVHDTIAKCLYELALDQGLDP